MTILHAVSSDSVAGGDEELGSLRAQLEAVGRELALERETHAAVRAQLAAVGLELTAERESSSALRDQAIAIGAELTAERTVPSALRDQLTAVALELEAERTQTAPLREQLAAVTEELAHERRDTVALRDQLGAIAGELAGERVRASALNDQLRSVGAELAALRSESGRWEESYWSAYRIDARARTEARTMLERIGRLDPATPDVGARVAALLADPLAAHLLDPVMDRRRRTAGLAPRDADDSPAILMVAVPKSASVLIIERLMLALRKPAVAAMGGAFPDFVLCQEGFMRLERLQGIAHTHLAPSRTNLLELSMRFGLDRLLVHLRDPRQVIVSWSHFIPAVIAHVDPVQRIHYDMPEEFLSWNEPQRLDWLIDHHLPMFIAWIDGWMRAPQHPWFSTRILFTTFEEMKQEPLAFFRRILSFYDVPPDRVPAEDLAVGAAQPGQHNFRRGEIDEWRRVFTPEQAERANALVPRAMLERFGWATA